MHHKAIKLLLLLALSFNIAHAAIIASHDHCSHATVSEYLQEIDHEDACDDLCHLHHLFHLSAILDDYTDLLPALTHTPQPYTTLLGYHPPFKTTEQKPPIA